MRKQNKKALVAMPDLKEVDIRPLFPNMVTMANLAAGFTSMQFAFWGKWCYDTLYIIVFGSYLIKRLS